jgi:hypothetical protein
MLRSYRRSTQFPVQQLVARICSQNIRSRCHGTRANNLVDTDKTGIPFKPTWSVRALLESYPKPSISADALDKLHRLSAINPPERGTPKHFKLTAEMEDLIKLVEAVRIPELTPEEREGGIPDGRIWAHDQGIELTSDMDFEDRVDGRTLLKHAAKTENGMYVVESDRTRR